MATDERHTDVGEMLLLDRSSVVSLDASSDEVDAFAALDVLSAPVLSALVSRRLEAGEMLRRASSDDSLNCRDDFHFFLGDKDRGGFARDESVAGDILDLRAANFVLSVAFSSSSCVMDDVGSARGDDADIVTVIDAGLGDFMLPPPSRGDGFNLR